MTELSHVTRTYKPSADSPYTVDIVTLGDTYEAWLYHDGYGVKNLMFGVPIAQQTYEQFVYLVELNMEEYIGIYAEEVEGK